MPTTDTDLGHEIIDVKVLGNFSPSTVLRFPSPLPSLVPTQISEQQAKELFDLVSSRNCNSGVLSAVLPSFTCNLKDFLGNLDKPEPGVQS
jgi:hypothetical protein